MILKCKSHSIFARIANIFNILALSLKYKFEANGFQTSHFGQLYFLQFTSRLGGEAVMCLGAVH